MPDTSQLSTVHERLYEADFFVWTEVQEAAIRAAGEAGLLPPEVDWARVAEEVGDMGRSELQSCESLTVQVLLHLFLIGADGRQEPKRHRAAEIVAFQGDLRRRLTPSIRRKPMDALEDLHVEAAKIAAAKLAAQEPAATIDAARRWTIEQVLGEARAE